MPVKRIKPRTRYNKVLSYYTERCHLDTNRIRANTTVRILKAEPLCSDFNHLKDELICLTENNSRVIYLKRQRYNSMACRDRDRGVRDVLFYIGGGSISVICIPQR